MKFFYRFCLLITITFYSFVKCNMNEIIRLGEFYQITSFVSKNFMKSPYSRGLMLQAHPGKVYSSDPNFSLLHDNSTENLKSRSMYSLQVSLVIFYTNNLNKIKPFLEFLVPQLTVRIRPKCLVMYSSNTSTDEMAIANIFKYTWEKKFLDFTVLTDSLSMIYHFNPFMNILHKIELDDDIELFPDKLANTHKYQFYIPDFREINRNVVTYIRRPSKKIQIKITSHSKIFFIAKIMNLTVVMKKTTHETLVPIDFLNRGDFDIYPNLITSASYFSKFLVPSDEDYKSFIAFVPIIPIPPRTSAFFETSSHVFIISVLFSLFLYTFNRFKNKLGSIEVFDLVRIFFGQSVLHVPQKTIHRIIYLTIIVATVKITNDFLLDSFTVQFDKDEVPFETYEDLYSSKLQTHATVAYLKYFGFLKTFKYFPYLFQILDKTLIIDYKSLDECFKTLKEYKNVSCIFNPHSPEWIISNFLDSYGLPTMKVANPPIFTQPAGFYWFVQNSPFAVKFLQVLRRIQETNLMYWPALVSRNRKILDVENTGVAPKISDGMESTQLLAIMTFCYLVSAAAFFSELIIFKIKKVLYKILFKRVKGVLVADWNL